MPTSAPLSKKKIEILGHEMAYHERGEGDPIVLLHGNPTSSYLWRNVVPHLEGSGRCVVPDLIGMGDSQKLQGSGPDRYTFVEHRRFLDALLAVQITLYIPAQIRISVERSHETRTECAYD